MVENTENDISLPPAWCTRRIRHITLRRVEELARQAYRLFREERVVSSRRVNDIVREEVIDRGKPRRIDIAKTRNLHGSGTIAEYGECAARAVPCEVNEDIDLIGMNPFGDLRIGKSRDVAPSRRVLL